MSPPPASVPTTIQFGGRGHGHEYRSQVGGVEVVFGESVEEAMPGVMLPCQGSGYTLSARREVWIRDEGGGVWQQGYQVTLEG